MEKLRSYLNALSIAMQREFANKCGTSIEYLRKAISAKQKLGEALSVQIEINSQGKVTRQDLHPNDWAQIWPELYSAA